MLLPWQLSGEFIPESLLSANPLVPEVSDGERGAREAGILRLPPFQQRFCIVSDCLPLCLLPGRSFKGKGCVRLTLLQEFRGQSLSKPKRPFPVIGCLHTSILLPKLLGSLFSCFVFASQVSSGDEFSRVPAAFHCLFPSLSFLSWEKQTLGNQLSFC